jgi:hypothetical protein
MNGACAGEHGIALDMTELLLVQDDHSAIDVTPTLKRALSPLCILTRRKVFT